MLKNTPPLTSTRSVEAANAILEQITALVPLAKHNEIISLCTQILPVYQQAQTYEPWATAAIALGNAHYATNQQNKVIETANNAIAVITKYLGEDYPLLINCYNLLGAAYATKGFYEKGIIYFKKTLQLCKLQSPAKHGLIYSLYINIATAYEKKMQLSYAVSYINQAFNYNKKHQASQNPLALINCYAILGSCYFGLDEKELAMASIDNSINLIKEHLSSKDFYLANSLNLKSNFCTNPKQALKLAKKALAVLFAINQHVSDLGGCTLRSIGLIFSFLRKNRLAEHYFKQSIKIFDAHFGSMHPYTASSYFFLGAMLFFKDDYNGALHYLQQALYKNNVIFDPAPASTNYYQLPKYHQYMDGITFLETISCKIKVVYSIYEEDEEQNFNYLLAALGHGVAAGHIVDNMRQQFLDTDNLMVFAKKVKKELDPVLHVCHHAQQVISSKKIQLTPAGAEMGYTLPNHAYELAFRTTEQCKAAALLGNVKERTAQFGSNIPEALIEQARNLRIELTYLEKCIQQEKTRNTKHTLEQANETLQNLQSQFFTHKLAYDELIARFETEYPDYYLLKYQTETVSIPEIQAALAPQQILIEYHVAQNNEVYIFAISRNEVFFIEQTTTNKFGNLSLNDAIENFLLFGIEDKHKTEYENLGYQLYQLLVEPVVKHFMVEADTSLIIIPDDFLAKLPFEALLTQPTARRTPYLNMPYLINLFNISYHFSATLWHYYQQNKQAQKPISQQGFIGFAPVYAAPPAAAPALNINNNAQDADELITQTQAIAMLRSKRRKRKNIGQIFRKNTYRSTQINGINCAALPYSELEITEVHQIFSHHQLPAESVLHEAATLPNFIRKVGQYKYVLLAGHGDYDPNCPNLSGFLFSPADNNQYLDYVLRLTDAYNLQLNADLVVLSCCDSGVGKLTQGEGVLAMNRGFLYAGSRNVIFTLFKVHDKESYLLTKQLFINILKGQTYAQALRQAKLSLITQGYLPQNWAGYVLIGE